MISNRMQEIKAKGFSMRSAAEVEEHFIPTDFSKIKVGAKTLDDAILELGSLRKIDPRLTKKETVLRAIVDNDLNTMREVYAISKIVEGEPAVVTIYSNWKTAVSAMERELLDIYEDLINDFDYYTDINELKEDFKDIYVRRNMNGDIVCISHNLTRIELTVADFDDKE